MASITQPYSQVEEGFRLSPQQRRLWHLHERNQGAAFGAQCLVRITGPLDTRRLDEAVTSVRTRHEILRTNFAFLEGTSIPVQVVNETASGLDATIALAGADDSTRELQLKAIVDLHWSRMRKLSQAPALLATLAEFSDEDHVLLLTASGLCGDAASLLNTVGEIRAAYLGEFAEGTEVLQYADVSEWQNQVLENGTAERDPYWNSAGFADLRFPRLPFERRTENLTGFAGGILRREATESLAAALDATACAVGVSVEAVLLAAWEILLHRFGGGDRFRIATSLDGRAQDELTGAIGPFTKTVPLSAIIDADHQANEFFQQVNRSLDIARYDQLLFSGDSFGEPGAASSGPLFPVVFTARHSFRWGIAESLRWEVNELDEHLELADLAITALTSDGFVRQIDFAWQGSLFAESDITIVADCYMALLREIGNGPNRRIRDFELPVESALEAVITRDDANTTGCSNVSELIEDQIRRVPHNPAVACGGVSIDYAELDGRASALARKLQRVGAKPDTVVAVMAERSTDFVVGILSVLKAGAAWLPIEPNTPTVRIEYMMREAGVVAILTQSHLAPPSGIAVPVVQLEAWKEAEADDPSERIRCSVDPRNLAYVIFTSGSTGAPKGVAIEHRQLAAYLAGLKAESKLPESAHFALVSTLAADLGHTAIFAALTSGGCVHVIPAEIAQDTEALARYFIQNTVHCVKIVPAHLHALCQSFDTATSLPWQSLIIGGEALSWDLVRSVEHLAPGCAVFNEYGPTETTVGVVCAPAKESLEGYCTSEAPIGRPRPNVNAYVLDENLRPVPAWMTGQLYVGGQCVGRGYLKANDLTAERFLPDPFSKSLGARMYMTGDLARLRSDGQLEFLGRADGQVKVRGYRVELKEVELALCRHPKVQNAAVALRDLAGSGKQLIAWVAVGPAYISQEDLREFLEQSLPSYMIPTSFVCLEKLKLTANGKLDHQALPLTAASSASKAIGETLSEPMDVVEESLLASWRQVLGNDSIGVDDNYFTLGGDSLRVVQIVHEARRYGLAVRAIDVLRYPTIRRLRKALRAEQQHSLFSEPLLSPFSESAKTGVPLTASLVDAYPISQMQAFVLKKYAQNGGPNPVYHIQVCFDVYDASFSPESLEPAFRAVVERHPALRTTFDLQSTPGTQQVRRQLQWALHTSDLANLDRDTQESRIAAALALDREERFDATDGETPLFRVAAFIRSATDFTLLFSCHHAIMDGWGHRVMLNQLVHAYTSFKSGRKPDLGAPDVACREFVALENSIRSSDCAAGFWRDYLSDIEPLDLSAYRPILSESVEPSIVCPLKPEFAQALTAIAQSGAVSLQALMLGAWLNALRKWSGQRTVLTGVVTNGRSEHLTDPLSAVGLFWNIVPLVSRETLPVFEQAASIQKELIDMQPYSAYPLLQILAEWGSDDLVNSTFRYLNFWNTKTLPEESGLKLLRTQSQDRYSFPLNCSAVLNPFRAGGYLQIEYDPAILSSEAARILIGDYEGLLKELAGQTCTE
jgi:amino acid adenylation domain-containing protein